MKIFTDKIQLQQANLDAANNQLVMIKGSSAANDGQTNFYIIVTPGEFGGTPDEVNDLTLANGNIAELMTGQTRFQSSLFEVWNGTAYESVSGSGLIKNYIVDGRFDFWFEGTNQTSTGYGSDTMYLNLDDTSTKTNTQETLAPAEIPEVPTAKFYSRTVVSSVAGASNFVRKEQRLINVGTLSGTNANFSFWGRVDSAKNVAVELVQNFGTGGSPSADVNSIGSQLVALTTGFNRVDVSIDIPSISGKTLGTDGNDSLRVLLWFDAGSSFDSRTASLGQQSGTFDLFGWQLTEGELAPFIDETFEQTSSRVSSFYQTGLVGMRQHMSAASSRFSRPFTASRMRSDGAVTITTVVAPAAAGVTGFIEDPASRDLENGNFAIQTDPVSTGTGEVNGRASYILDARL